MKRSKELKDSKVNPKCNSYVLSYNKIEQKYWECSEPKIFFPPLDGGVLLQVLTATDRCFQNVIYSLSMTVHVAGQMSMCRSWSTARYRVADNIEHIIYTFALLVWNKPKLP